MHAIRRLAWTYRRVKDILTQRRGTLERITAELQKRETIGHEDE